MIRMKEDKPRLYSWLFPYPGDWHILLHSAKALISRYWGAGIEHVAKEFSGTDKNAAEGRHYRRSHHQLTVMYEALITVVAMQYKSLTGGDPEESGAEDKIKAWMLQRAAVHKTFKLWTQFILQDYPAYMALRIAVRTGNFKLRLAALRRIAPIFCGHGKARYQWLLAVHLSHMARMTDEDMEALSHLFSTPLTGNAYARVALDERQEFANKLYKGSTTKITVPFVSKLPALVTAREHALTEIRREYLATGVNQDPVADVLRKRRDAVSTATSVLTESLAFTDKGAATLMSLDGREALLTEAQEILSQHEACDDKWRDVVNHILGDPLAKGCTKVHMKSFPPTSLHSKGMKRAAKPSTAIRNLKNTGQSARELHNVLNAIAADVGSMTRESLEKRMLEIGSTVSLSMANIDGGMRLGIRTLPRDRYMS